jgi:hypothetical protein
MTTTCKPSPRIAGMWQAELRRMLHPGYRLILRWCEHLPFEDVVLIDRASIAEAATNANRFAGAVRIAFGDAALPMKIVPFTLVNVTHQYVLNCAREGPEADSASAVFAEIFGEPVTRASLRDAIYRAMVLLRLAYTLKIDEAGHVV